MTGHIVNLMRDAQRAYAGTLKREHDAAMLRLYRAAHAPKARTLREYIAKMVQP